MQRVQPNSFLHGSSNVKGLPGLVLKTPKENLQDRSQATKPNQKQQSIDMVLKQDRNPSDKNSQAFSC